MDKTGTSAVQKFLYINRMRLFRDAAICYPNTGLWSDFSHHPFAFSIFEQQGYGKFELSELVSRFQEETASYENVILASECLFKAPYRESFNTFRDLVFPYFKKIYVIIYLRSQDSWVESRYKHSIISGSEIDIEKLKKPWFCNYKQFLDKWADIVGVENVIVRPYDKKQFVSQNIYADFLSVLNISEFDDYEYPDGDVNASLSNDELMFKKLCNDIGMTSEGVDKLNGLLFTYSAIANTRKRVCGFMTTQERRLIMDEYNDINRSIAEKYLDRNNGQLFHPEADLNLPEVELCSPLTTDVTKDILDFIRLHATDVYELILKNSYVSINADDLVAKKAGSVICDIVSHK